MMTKTDVTGYSSIYLYVLMNSCTRWRSWLRHYATSQKVAGSSPTVDIGFYN
jgi:hypothetical protein